TNEFQVFQCSASDGYFKLTFAGQTTAPIAFDSTLTELQQKIDYLTINPGGVVLSFVSGLSSSTQICTANEIRFEYRIAGDVPLFGVVSTGLTGSTTFREEVKGTTT